MYNSIERYYNMGLYTIDQMKVFVAAKWITAEQFETITGVPYEA